MNLKSIFQSYIAKTKKMI